MGNNSNHDSNHDSVDERIGAMDLGYIIFTAPFILFCIGIVAMVIFNVR